MKKQEKEKIKRKVGSALSKILESVKVSKPSKKTVKAISKVSKALRKDLEEAHKKQKNSSVKSGFPKKESPSVTIKKISSKKRAPIKQAM